MTEQEMQQDDQQTQESQTPGQILTAARLAQGIELSDLSEQMKVPMAVLEAIEKGKVPKNLPETFIRGYIRSYARKVGVEESQVLPQMETHAAFEKPETTGRQEMQSFSRRTKRKALERRLTIATWIIVLVLILAAAIWWWQDSRSQDFAPVAGEVTNAVEVMPAEVTNVDSGIKAIELSEPQASLEQDENQTGDSDTALSDFSNKASNDTLNATSGEIPQQASNLAASNLAEFTATEIEAQSSEAVQPQVLGGEQPIQLTQEQKALIADNGEGDDEGFMKVEMHFENDCWVEVHDAMDERIAVGNKPAGYLMTLNAQGPFSVLLGNPVGVSIWINGRPYDMSSLPRNRVARFEIDATDVESLEVQ